MLNPDFDGYISNFRNETASLCASVTNQRPLRAIPRPRHRLEIHQWVHMLMFQLIDEGRKPGERGWKIYKA